MYIVLKDVYNNYYCYRALVSCTASAYESVPGAKLNHRLFKPYNFQIKQNYNIVRIHRVIKIMQIINYIIIVTLDITVLCY